jgi:hypothetical protein
MSRSLLNPRLNSPRARPHARNAFLFAAIFFALALFATTGVAQISVSGGSGLAATYPSLTNAAGLFAAINATAQTGNNIVVTITGDVTTEAGTNSLNAGAWSTISIQPSGARTISGAVAGVLINLSGADNVTIDGLNSGGNSLIVENTSTNVAAATIRFIADATNNTVQNCTIKGSGTSTTLGTFFFSTGTTTGNVGNTITNNNITPSGANLPLNAIYSSGTSAAVPNTVTVSNNNISDQATTSGSSSVGINVFSTGNTAWTITGNRIFQTTARAGGAAIHYGIRVQTGNGNTVSNNVIGFATSSGTGTWTMNSSSGAFRFVGIDLGVLTTTATEIHGNTIAGFNMQTTSGAATTNGIFAAINVTGGRVNIGTTSGNTIGATTGTGSIVTTTSTTGALTVGINSTSTSTVAIQNNAIGAIDALGTAATVAPILIGIQTAGTAGNYAVSNNTIGNATANSLRVGTSGTTTAATAFQGINNAATGTISITGNTIQNCSSFTSGAGVWTGITNTAGVGTLNITTNNLIAGTLSGTGAFTGISNSASPATLNINTNVIRSHSKSATTGTFTGVINTGIPTTALNINSNQLGNATGGLITYTVANSGTLTGITTSAPAAAAAYSINSNDIRGIVNSAASTQIHNYITWSSQGSVASTVNNNTFTNLSINTTGAVTFFTHGTATPLTATGSMSINSNSIVTGFANAAVSAITIFTSGAGDLSPNGSAITYNLNNFSNIILTGASGFTGISDANGASTSSGPTKAITNNTFDSITTGAAQITGISFNFSGNNTTVSNNTLTNLTAGGVILAISAGTSNSGATETISGNILSNLTSGGQVNALQTGLGPNLTTGNITSNTITNISSSSAAANPIFPIICSGFGATNNISKNKIGNIQSAGNALAASSVFGILAQTGGTTYNISNNLIGDLRLPANPAANNLQGINIGALTAGTTVNLFYNTVWLNESVNAQAGFGSSAVSVSTTPTVVMRNNILVNTSVRNTTGLTVAYRRGSSTLTTYGAASNNNDFYAGTPGANNLIYSDGTNSNQTITTYKSLVASRDSLSFTESPTFVITTAADPTFLHINTAVATQLESAAANIATFTDDFDGNVRQGNAGYSGTGVLPDVGADEFEGVSNASDLAALTLTAGALSPSFSASTTSYTVGASNATTSTTVTPTVARQTSTVTVNGTPVTSGNPSGSIALAAGNNTITIVVTAAGGSPTKTYTVVVNRAKADQTITFNAIPTKTYGDPAFNPGATASSGLTVSYVSSDTNVATVSGSTITIVGAGTSTITASQAGDANFNPAPSVDQTLTVNRKALSITADSGQYKVKGAADPTFTYMQTGLVGGDSISGVLSRSAGETPGSYAITQGALTNANNPNYDITFTSAQFVIAGPLAAGDSASRIANSASFKIPKTSLSGNDIRVHTDGTVHSDSLSVTGVASGTGNTVSLSGAFVFYTPDAPADGTTRTFTYTLTDATTGATDTATVTVTTAAAAPFTLDIVEIGTATYDSGNDETSITVGFISIASQSLTIEYSSPGILSWTTAGVPNPVSTGSGAFQVTITAPGDQTADWNNAMFFRATRQ